jgi:hypothetical protein
MRAPLLRETGSILVRAPRDQVFEALRTSLRDQPGLRATDASRLQTDVATFVLRDAPGGTQVIHARAAPVTLPGSARPREELRASVEFELFQLQKKFA